MNSGVELGFDWLTPDQVLFDDERHVAGFDAAVPNLVWGDADSRARTALSHTTAAVDGDAGDGRISKSLQDFRRAVSLARLVLTNHDTAVFGWLLLLVVVHCCRGGGVLHKCYL